MLLIFFLGSAQMYSTIMLIEQFLVLKPFAVCAISRLSDESTQ